jgi:transposase
VNVWGQYAPSHSTIYRWYKRFERGIYDLEDDVRKGRPVIAVSDKNVVRVRKLIEEDRHITYLQLKETKTKQSNKVYFSGFKS